jgi:hypothetical protein
MEEHIKSIEQDFGRVISLWEMTEFVGSSNKHVEQFFKRKLPAGFQVSYSAMITELVVTIGRILDHDKRSYGLKGVLKHFKERNSDNSDAINAVERKSQQLDEIYLSKEFEEIIKFFRNKLLAHSDKGFEMPKGDIKTLFEFCHLLECFLISFGIELGISFDLSNDYHAYWSKQATEYWLLAVAVN